MSECSWICLKTLCMSSLMTLLSWPVWVGGAGTPLIHWIPWQGCSLCCSFVCIPWWTFSLEKQWKMRHRSEARNLCSFQGETGSFLQRPHLESELCCDLLILKLVEKALWRNAWVGGMQRASRPSWLCPCRSSSGGCCANALGHTLTH